MNRLLATYVNGQNTLAFGTGDRGLLPVSAWHDKRGAHSEIPCSAAWPNGCGRLPRLITVGTVRDRNSVRTHSVYLVIVDGPGRNTTFEAKVRT